MGWTCGMYGGEEEEYRILVGNLKEREHLEHITVNGRIILNGP
jgi:hypothetical protein